MSRYLNSRLASFATLRRARIATVFGPKIFTSRDISNVTGTLMASDKFNGFDTISLHGGYDPDPTVTLGLGQGAPRGIPVYRTAPYLFKDTEHAAKLFGLAELGNVYSRIMNPTNNILETRYALLEGGHPLSALAVASGTNAIHYAIINLASCGDNIVSGSALYGGTYTMFNDLLPNLGIEVRFVDMNDPEAFVKAADDKTRAFFCESVTNPSLEIADVEKIADAAHSIGLPLIVDSTFSTPYLCKPFDFGADIITNSLTKWIGGHGACLGGIIVDKGEFNWAGGKHPLYDIPDTSYGGEAGLRWGHDLPEALAPLAFKLRALTVPLRNFGGCMSPDNAWIIIQGIETMSLRMERHCENAFAVAEYLTSHPKVSWVRYPGLPDDPQHELTEKYLKGKGGAMVVFGIKSDDPMKAGQKFIDNLELFSHVANVGDAKSLAIHPATTTHSQLREDQQRIAGVTPDLVRLSIGIEDIGDIIKDIEDTLEKV